jgi:DNA-binding NtrC family response regulator
MNRRALIVDDDRAECELLADGLSTAGFDVEWTLDPDSALDLLRTRPFSVVITDLNMPKMTGAELCRRASLAVPGLPVVVVTGFGSIDTAVETMRAGAYDFVTKPFDVDAITMTLSRAIDHFELRREVEALRTVRDNARSSGALLGASPAMRDVNDLIDRVARSDVTVLITGESGTGKELVAREIHRRSKRKEGPFVALNCAAVPEALLESELFGHIKGAFTDAREKHEGLLLHATGGTLFLDEIGDMPLAIQPKLLRALQERVVRPVGGNKEVAFDARVITATNLELERAVEEKRFREDLYYRVNVVHVEAPPLRARGGDVLLLATTFVSQSAARIGRRVTGLSPDAADKVMSYDWPGNVRELANCIERAVALTRGDTIQVDDLPRKLRDYEPHHVIVAGDDPTDLVPMEEVEKRYILRVLQACKGNKSMAADVLRISRKTLYRRLETWGVSEN